MVYVHGLAWKPQSYLESSKAMTDTEQSSQQPIESSLLQKLLYRLRAAIIGFVTGLIPICIYVGCGGDFVSFGKIEGVLLFSSLCGLAAGLFPQGVIQGILNGLSYWLGKG
jgi:hypothetical protein